MGEESKCFSEVPYLVEDEKKKIQRSISLNKMVLSSLAGSSSLSASIFFGCSLSFLSKLFDFVLVTNTLGTYREKKIACNLNCLICRTRPSSTKSAAEKAGSRRM